MRKYFIYLVTATTLVYYAALPFVVAQAGGNPGGVDTSTDNTASTAAIAADGIPSIPAPLYMRVTAYASVPDETDSTPFITANGTRVYYGEAASNILPFGTKIEIPALFGSQIFTIEDRMSEHIKNTIDIWMPTVAAAIRFGMDHTNIIIVSEPSSTEDMALANATK
jgi:3D (Asp-Asp-Asp) domain-containing protein